MDRIPKPGEFYRHFNNKLYQIMAVARHTETGEELVVYQALYGDFRIYARPLSMFLEPVDREKYPDAGQEHRFEQVVFVTDDEEGSRAGEEDVKEGQREESRENGAGYSERSRRGASRKMNPWLERFLDADGYDQQLERLSQMIGKIGQRELGSVYLSLDIPMPHGAQDVDSQIRDIMKILETRKRYDGSRLR